MSPEQDTNWDSLNTSNTCNSIPTNSNCIVLNVKKCTLDKLVEVLEQDIKKNCIFKSIIRNIISSIIG